MKIKTYKVEVVVPLYVRALTEEDAGRRAVMMVQEAENLKLHLAIFGLAWTKAEEMEE